MFTIILELLSYTIKTQTRGLIRGVQVGKDNIELIHLQIADDTFILFIPKGWYNNEELEKVVRLF